MSINVDGFAVLAAIAANADMFEGIKADVTKQASALVLKQLKARSADLTKVREVCRVLGANNFSLIADEMTGAQIKTLLNKLDRHRTEGDKETVLSRRQHFYALANGSQEATSKPAATKKLTKSRSTKKIHGSEDRGPSDEPLFKRKSAVATRPKQK
jgi:hypothetical protein